MASLYPSPFAEQLRRYRRERGLTQEELAELAGMSARGIRALEQGERTAPHTDTVRLLGHALQLSPVDQAAFEAAARRFAGRQPVAPQNIRLPTGNFLGARPAGPLVARDRELGHVLELVERVEQSEGRLVMLAGEPGIGKTRLAQEVMLRLVERGFLVVTGRCYAPEQSVAYYPFAQALEMAYRSTPPDLQADVPRRWSYLERLLPDRPFTADPEQFGGQNVQHRLIRTVAHFLDALAEIRPVAVLIDDLQWADESSLQLTEHLARITRSSRIFLLGTYRDEDIDRRHPLERTLRELHREGLLTELVIRRLPEEGTAAQAAALIGQGLVSESLVALLHARTDGNPFFTQEVIWALLERGDLSLADGIWERRVGAEIEVPRSIRSAIGERLSRLGQDAQSVLAEASVLGPTFAVSDLVSLQSRAAEQVDAALDEAVTARLIRVMDTNRYTFSHVLTQQTLYEELPARRRIRLHFLAAEALERLPPEARRNRVTELARHYRQANEDARALPYVIAAGDQAEAAFAYAEAVHHYDIALELAHGVGDQQREAEVLEKLGAVLRLQMEYDQALDILEQAASAYRALDDPEGEARATYQLGVALYMKGQPREAGARVGATVARLEGLSGPPSFQRALAYVYWALAMPSCLTGQYRDILSMSTRIAELGQAVHDDRLLAAAAWMRGYGLVVVGAPEEARQSLEEAVSFFQETDDKWWLAQVTCQIGRTHLHEGNVDRAEPCMQQTLALFEEAHDQAELAWASCYMGDVEFVRGNWAGARSHFERSSRLARDTVPRFYSHALLHVAELSLLEGAGEQAMEHIEESLAVAHQCSEVAALRKAQRLLAELDLASGDPERGLDRLQPLLAEVEAETPHAFPPPVLAELHLALGEDDRADQLVAERIERFRRQRRRRGLVSWLRVQGKVRLHRDQLSEARLAYAEAASLARAMPYPHAEASALYDAAVLLGCMGELQQARELVGTAQVIFQRLSAQPDTQRAQRVLSELG